MKHLRILLASLTVAAIALPAEAVRLKNPLGTDSVFDIAGNIIRAFVGLVGAVALLMFIYGGFLWLTSGGSTDKVKQGTDVMKWAGIGLAIVLSSAALVQFVLNAFSR